MRATRCYSFALGTNDLTAYTLAVDRGDADVAFLYDPLHPAVLRLIQFATQAALRANIPVSVCGEIGANPKLVPLLLGLGLRSFSMNASAVPRVKQRVRAVELAACERLAADVMAQSAKGSYVGVPRWTERGESTIRTTAA